MISNSLKMMVDANTAPVINSLSVTKNGTYTAPDGVDGYSPITVDVQEQPWQPLQDGYSNFWFELTNDTLSPWLNFSAKNNDAVIDWGDGSGEQALTTLTPTHTYSKAGKYVVKVKGVTGIGQRYNVTDNTYGYALKAVELNSEVVSAVSNTFAREAGLTYAAIYNDISVGFSYSTIRKIIYHSTAPSSPASCYMCLALEGFDFTGVTKISGGSFQYCTNINKIILPSSVQSIGNTAFGQCGRLYEVHCQATTPPTLGSNVFIALPSNWICYVPVGYGNTYKAASGWSTYANHILEEGQTPNRMMLAKFNSAKTEESEVKEDELHQDENR